jgi:hypothetical protein
MRAEPLVGEGCSGREREGRRRIGWEPETMDAQLAIAMARGRRRGIVEEKYQRG